MMSREDLLQELELLPVWQLRNPLPQANVDALAKEGASETVAEEWVAQVEAPVVEQVAETSQYAFRLVVSEEAQWAFVLGQHDAEAEQLLQNMLKAVAVKINQDNAAANVMHLNQCSPKAIVVMGEREAQQLLNTELSIEQMRGKPQLLQDAPVIVTYSPSYLLLNLADKAKAWEDLCLAKLTIANL